MPTTPMGTLIVLAVAAALLLALVTWGVLRWILRAPGPMEGPVRGRSLCPECGGRLTIAGDCPQCARRAA